PWVLSIAAAREGIERFAGSRSIAVIFDHRIVLLLGTHDVRQVRVEQRRAAARGRRRREVHLQAKGFAEVVVDTVVPAIGDQASEPYLFAEVEVGAQPSVVIGLSKPEEQATAVVVVQVTVRHLGTDEGIELANVEGEDAVCTSWTPRRVGLL